MCKVCLIDGCKNEAVKNRRYCRQHFLERKRNRAKERYHSGEYNRTTYDKECIVCGKKFKAWKKKSMFFSIQCANHSISPAGQNNYVYNDDYKNGIWIHRAIAQQILNRKLETDEVVHHIDLNPRNNELSNLIVMPRRKHASLHRFLSAQGASLKRLGDENIENCWKLWIGEMTTTWLETANVKVIKLSQYRQSAS